MVSIERTSVKYRGKYAADYEAKRKKQIRWHQENEIVEAMLIGLRGTVLDCPVGTGRFLHLYQAMGLKCYGVDSSEEMLAQAKRRKGRHPSLHLMQQDARDLPFKDASIDHTVCVRFLDLIDEPAMYEVMHEFLRVTRKTIICTIRFGGRYIAKVNTATHDERKFGALIKRKGWKITEQKTIFQQGWNVLKLEKSS
jgi:ubiquinone/menaquinone biosynthesis C-methylase UbiE